MTNPAGLEASVLGPASRYPLLGDWVDPGDTVYGQWTTRSSTGLDEQISDRP